MTPRQPMPKSGPMDDPEVGQLKRGIEQTRTEMAAKSAALETASPTR
jgi:hypothetical protein